MAEVSRRGFLRIAGATGVAGAALASPAFAFLKPIVGIDNPLDFYPDRGWEKVYRDQYRYDSSFAFVCSPNDTHS